MVNRWLNTDADIVVLTREARPHRHNIRYVRWDARTLGGWAEELEGATGIINLVGKSVNCRYTAANKAEIIRSRVDSTAVIGEAIQQSETPPDCWINAGSAAIFGDAGDSVKTESDAVGNGFSAEVCKQWEATFQQCETRQTRKVFLRIGIVIQSRGGILRPFINLARFGLGGRIGTGEQYLSWIHESDFADLIEWTMENDSIVGVLHACSPCPVKNGDFMAAIRKKVGVPFGIPSAEWSTRLGARLIGTEPELVLSGRRVVSERLEKAGFQFNFPELRDALQNLVL